MANLSKPSKHAVILKALEGEPATEQEHKDSCDINLMMKNIDRGRQVRTRQTAAYGYDDIGIDATALRIQKAGLEEALLSGQKEFSQKELDLIPKHIQEKFGYKLKKEAAQNDAKNDDQTTKKATKQAASKKQKQAEDPENSSSNETPES